MQSFPPLRCLQYAKIKGEAWSILISSNRGRESLNELEAFPCSVCASTEVLNVCEVENLPLIVQDTKCIFSIRISIPYLKVDIDVIHM